MQAYYWARADADGILSKGPTYISALIATPHDDKKVKYTLYDGESAKDPKIFEVKGLTNDSKIIVFSEPFFVHRGLFVDMDSDTHELTVLMIIMAE